MKLCIMTAILALMLSGCGAKETMETIADDWVQPAMAQPREICVNLPGEAAMPAVEGSNGRIYVCEDYEIVIQTYPSGDLEATIRELCGYDKEDLTVMATVQDYTDRYDFVWVSAGEGGDQLGRAVVLDDGDYHYTMTVTRPADTTETSQITWSQVFESFSLNTKALA